MTTMGIRRLALIALAAILAATCLTIAQQPIILPGFAMQDSKPTFVDKVELPAWPPSRSLETFKNATNRPLFHWSRRALPKRPAQAALSTSASAATAVLPNFLLRGAVISSDRRVAIIEKPGEPDYLRLYEKQSIEGWTVAKIEASSALLTSGSQKMELTLTPR